MDWILVGVAGFLGGMLNALAGGGSFLTLPALIFAGVPPVAANATGTAALLPGYIASAWRFRKDIKMPAGLGYISITLISIVGGCLGAGILLVTDESVFSALIPWLILFATLAFVISPKFVKGNKLGDKHEINKKSNTFKISAILLIICIYGGYFNGGLGIIVLAALGLLGQTNLLGMNGLKNYMSVMLTVIAVAVYAIGGTISVKYLGILGLGSILGGYAGAVVAYKLSQKQLRYIIIVIGCLMSIAFFVK